MQFPEGTRAYCSLPYEELFIIDTGEVLFGCCQGPAQTMGNVLRQSLEEIWNSPLADDVRRLTVTPQLHPNCRHGCFVSDRIAQGDPPLYDPRHTRWPTKVTISLPASHCNIGGVNPTPDTACLMCGRAAPDFVQGPDHSERITAQVKPLLEHLTVLGITGIAEAFWKGRIFEILDQLEFPHHADRIKVETNSNGTTLSQRVRETWLGTCPRSHLVVSLDAASAATYRKIRRLDAYDTIIANLRGYVRERNPARQNLVLAHTINLLNIREVEGMVETASEIGVDSLLLTLTLPWVDQVRPYVIADDTAILFAKAHARAVRRAEALGVRISFGRFLHGEHPELVELKAS